MIHEEEVDDPEEQLDDFNHELPGYHAVRRRQMYMLNVRRRHIRDISNPFDVTQEIFVKSYRFHQDLFFRLVDIISPFMHETASANALPLELKASRELLLTVTCGLFL